MLQPSLYLETIPQKGRSVFAGKAIPADTVVEEAPVVVMTAEERVHLDQTLLHDYIFEWEPDGPDGEKKCCMALGWVPLFNHSYTSNCEYFMHYDEEMMQIKTVREIEPGEELTINYNGEWNNETPVWFDVSE